jgi:hypothetical protein
MMWHPRACNLIRQLTVKENYLNGALTMTTAIHKCNTFTLTLTLTLSLFIPAETPVTRRKMKLVNNDKALNQCGGGNVHP